MPSDDVHAALAPALAGEHPIHFSSARAAGRVFKDRSCSVAGGCCFQPFLSSFFPL